ncbi:putative Cofilin/actin-depolymerizing factor-like protein [Hypsibius exemplaris]|uniref:Cofilin/actin-depolymerizing factor-like protein n=1 Tax=Hypsibius exemplaris TaxID=2072580 RepID=A0A1W0WKB9_HYPEX|nr:putative Cofilin/actin-depolymerizing factor-like protein [Hypsibius exemplaris]
MASGVTIADDCKVQFEAIKRDKKHRYLIFVIKDEKQIVVEKQGERNGKYEHFVQDLLAAGPDDCRYGVFDYEYDHLGQGTASSVLKQKLILMSWCPDTAKIKKKMLYSSSFDALKKALVGIAKYVQATDESEASKEAVEEKLRSTDRA